MRKRSRRKVKYEKGVPAKYLKNKKNSKAYKEGRYIDLKAVQKSRATRKKKK